MKKRLLTFFPKSYNPSNLQSSVINKVEEAFLKHKFVILSAPTGTGKSFISATLASSSNPVSKNFSTYITNYDAFRQNFSGQYVNDVECLNEPNHGSFVLTITKALQDQYHSLFGTEAFLFKGKTNYMCDVDGISDVEVAPCIFAPKLREDCWSKNRCPYYNARNEALLNKFSVLNYKLFFTLPDHVKRKNYIICDEASELENELVRNFTVFVDFDKAQLTGIKLPRPKNELIPTIMDWASEVTFLLSEHQEKLLNKLNAKNSNVVLADKVKYSYIKNLNNSIQSIIKNSDIEWVVERDKNKLTCTPLNVDRLAKNIFDNGEKILLMSATIIDHENFAKKLGISDYCYIEGESIFDEKKSPIYVSTKHSLNYGNLKIKIPLIAEQIKKICDEYGNSKGIIHTHSMEITNMLKKHLKGRRFLFRDDTATNDHILKEHYQTEEPTVLVSPSMVFGIDLKDDYARFSIIVKLPYPPLSNKRIKKIFDVDKNWYENQMLNALVQMCGRATRSSKDFSNTYILDGNIIRVLQNCSNRLPDYFIKRFH